MLVIYGRYRWFPRRVAFRNDYCLRCEGPTLALAERTFDVLHVFWLPLVPIGFWRRWFCIQCDHQPSQPTRTRRSFKWAGVVLLVIFAAVFWLAPLQTWDPEIDTAFVWAARVATVIAIPLVVWNIRRSPGDVSYRQARRSVLPYREPTCPICGGVLSFGTDPRCESCGLRRA